MMSAGGFVTHFGAAGFFNNNNKKRVANPKIGGGSGVNQAYGGGAYEHPPQISSSNDNSVMMGGQVAAGQTAWRPKFAATSDNFYVDNNTVAQRKTAAQGHRAAGQQ
jgi:hypothetical protein